VADGIAAKLVVATSDRPYFVLKSTATSNGGVWQFDDYTNPKAGSDYPEIILRAFTQNVDAGKWYRWSSGSDFDTVRLQDDGGVTKEASISVTYWTEISSNATHPVAADATEWDDDVVNKEVIYKYQSGAFFDILRIERIKEGATVKSLVLHSSAGVVSYLADFSDYDPADQVVQFQAIGQNLDTSGIEWMIYDKDGNDISADVTLYDAPTAGSAIATGATTGKRNAGHRFSIGSSIPLRYNLHIIHIQSEHSNNFKGGDNDRYDDGLIKVYGQEYRDYIHTLRQTKPLHLTIETIKEKIIIAKLIKKELIELNNTYTPTERIELRHEYNKRLGIYL